MPRVWVVEDEAVTRSLYDRLLNKMGCRYDMAAGISEARRWIEGKEGCDLLITDIRLPDGNGLELVKIFRERFPNIPVLVVTGSPLFPAQVPNPKEIGVELLFKPFELSDFTGLVERLLAEGPRNN